MSDISSDRSDFDLARIAEFFPLWTAVKNLTNRKGDVVKTEFFGIPSRDEKILILMTTEELVNCLVALSRSGKSLKIDTPASLLKMLEQEKFTHVAVNPLPTDHSRHFFTTDEVIAQLRRIG